MTTPGQPGWYDDPYDPHAQRYWDGQGWTAHNQPKPVSQADLGFAETAIAPMPYQQAPYPQQLYPQQPYPQEPYAQAPYQVSQPPPNPYGQWAPPGQPPPGGPRRSSNFLPVILIAAVVGVVVLVIGGILVFKFALSDKPVSDQDKIKSLVHTFTDDFNNSDIPGLKSLLCKADGGKADGLRRLRSDKGPLTTSVTNVTVTGDNATAQVDEKQGTRSDSEAWYLVREGGAWKVCPSFKHGH